MSAARCHRFAVILALGLLAGCSTSTHHAGGATSTLPPTPPPTSASSTASSSHPQAEVDGNGGLAVGAGSVWVLVDSSNTTQLHRLDATSLKPVATVPTGHGAISLTYGAGAVWVPNADDGTVTRVDPATNSARTIKVGGAPWQIGADSRSVWLVDTEGTVVRLDPASGKPVGRPFDFGHYATYRFQAEDCDIVVESNALYVFTTGGASFRIRLRGGKPAAVDKFRAAAAMAPDGGSLWVTDVDPDSLAKVDMATGRVLLQRPVFGQTLVATADGLWYSNRHKVTRADKQTGEPISTVTVGSSDSNLTLAIGDGQVWAFNVGDDTLARLDP
jgi:YVTN family beta-propeller protein